MSLGQQLKDAGSMRPLWGEGSVWSFELCLNLTKVEHKNVVVVWRSSWGFTSNSLVLFWIFQVGEILGFIKPQVSYNNNYPAWETSHHHSKVWSHPKNVMFLI